MMIRYYRGRTMKCVVIVPAHLVPIDLYFFDKIVYHPLVLPNRKRELEIISNIFLSRITRFDDRFEGSLEAKDTFIDRCLPIQTTFRQEYDRTNEFYVYY